MKDNNYSVWIQNIRTQLKTYITDNDLKSLVMGVSGGADSTLCALLAAPVCEDLGIQLIGRSITIDTNTTGEVSRAKNVGTSFCTDFEEVDLTKAFVDLVPWVSEGWMDPDVNSRIRMGNVKARMRMIFLYNLASENNGIVLSTDNYTELMLGFWTLHGDVGDYGMIQNLWKTEVYEMLEYLAETEVTETGRKYVTEVIEADATDGLGVSTTDLDQILPGWKGSSRDGYAQVDKIFQDQDQDPENPVWERHFRTEFKRVNPINIPRSVITEEWIPTGEGFSIIKTS